MTQQGLKQKTVRALTGRSLSYAGDWLALFDQEGIPDGAFNGRMLRWLNQVMGSSYTTVGAAQQAFAEANGAFNWQSMGAFEAWSPKLLGTRLKLELDPARRDLITAGSNVSSITDTVGGRAFTEGFAASQPAWDPAAFSGRGAIAPDGTDDMLTNAVAPPVAAPFEMWALVNQIALVADATNRVIWEIGGPTANNRIGLRRAVVGGVSRARVIVGDGSTAVNVTNTGADFSGVSILRAVVRATEALVEINGVSMTPTAVTPSLGVAMSRLFATAQSSPSIFGNAPFGYGALVQGELTAEEASNFRTYLQNRST